MSLAVIKLTTKDTKVITKDTKGLFIFMMFKLYDMEKDMIIRKAEDFAKENMKNYDPGHDWWHIKRVRHIAESINSSEGSADPFILDLSAILHDVADSKFSRTDDKYSEIEKFLSSIGSDELKLTVLNAIRNISFSNKNPSGDLKDPVFLILQDADRLDAIGAIGIARAFSYGSSVNNPIHLPPDENGYLAPSTIRHFYDKLLKLKDLMNTECGKKMAEERHNFLNSFLEQFYKEWDIQ